MIDYPYIILVIILAVCAFLYWRKKQKEIFYFSAFISFCFIAFRAPVVGADTWNYVKYFTGRQSYYIYEETRELEPLFLGYNWLLHLFTYNGVVYLFINTIIATAPVYYLVKKYSYNGVLSILLFFVLNFHGIYFVALRQVLALSFNLWAFIFVLEKRKYHWWWFAAFSIISYFFHTSSLIIVVLYLLTYFLSIYNRWVYIILIIASFIIGRVIASTSYVELFNAVSMENLSSIERISPYLNDSVNNDVFAKLNLREVVLGLFIFSILDKEKLNNWMVKLYFFSVVAFNLFIAVPMYQRLSIGVSLMTMIVFTWCFSKKHYHALKYKSAINIVVFLIIVYITVPFILSCVNPDLNEEGRMHPYYWFFEDYRDHPSIKRF